jgi:hypothetical protein
MSYIILRGHWCDIIVLNVHAPTEDKTDDLKNRFYEVVSIISSTGAAICTAVVIAQWNSKR